MNNQLILDWLEGLTILRRSIDNAGDISLIWGYHNVQYSPDSKHRLVNWTESPGPIRTLQIATMVETLPRIERIEVLTYAACGAWYNYFYPGHNVFHDPPREAFQQLCRRAGCWHTNTREIRERWRLIDFYTPAHLLPNAVFEDRTHCKVCKNPVATGAEAWVVMEQATGGSKQVRSATEDEIAAAQLGNCWISPDRCVQIRWDAHEECMRFVHRVLVPARKIQMRQAATASGVGS